MIALADPATLSTRSRVPPPSRRRPKGAGVSTDPRVSALLDPDTLVERYGERIYRVARRMTNSDADAEDVTQNTLIKILRKAASYRGESDPMGWIYRIAMNVAREAMSRRSSRPKTASLSRDASGAAFAECVPSTLPGPDTIGEGDEMRSQVRDAVMALPETEREGRRSKLRFSPIPPPAEAPRNPSAPNPPVPGDDHHTGSAAHPAETPPASAPPTACGSGRRLRRTDPAGGARRRAEW